MRTLARYVVVGMLLGMPAVAMSTPSGAPAGDATEQAATAPAVTAGYEKGFFIRHPTKPYQLRINGRIQGRYEYELTEQGADHSAFSVARARLKLGGVLFSKQLTWALQTDFGKGNVVLKDAYVDYAFIPGWLHARMGQWKRPFSRQQITSSGKLEMVDRAITDGLFHAGRDIGFALHNGYEKSPTWEYIVGVFNGTGDRARLKGDVEVDPATGVGEIVSGKLSNVPSHFLPAIVARVGYNHGGIKGYSEGDLEGGPFRFSVGLSGILELDADGGDDGAARGQLDVLVKAHGFAATAAGYVASFQSGGAALDHSYEGFGAHVQLSYLIHDIVQPVLRYAVLLPDGGNNLHEAGIAISVYLFGHNVKWQTEALALLEEQTAQTIADYLFRTQIQLAF